MTNNLRARGYRKSSIKRAPAGLTAFPTADQPLFSFNGGGFNHVDGLTTMPPPRGDGADRNGPRTLSDESTMPSPSQINTATRGRAFCYSILCGTRVKILNAYSPETRKTTALAHYKNLKKYTDRWIRRQRRKLK